MIISLDYTTPSEQVFNLYKSGYITSVISTTFLGVSHTTLIKSKPEYSNLFKVSFNEESINFYINKVEQMPLSALTKLFKEDYKYISDYYEVDLHNESIKPFTPKWVKKEYLGKISMPAKTHSTKGIMTKNVHDNYLGDFAKETKQQSDLQMYYIHSIILF